MSSSYRRSLEEWLREQDVAANTVIDVGGAQLPVKGRTRSWKVDDYMIFDLAEPHTGAPKPDFVIDLEQKLMMLPEADIVFCLEVFEYLIDPLSALQNIHAMTKGIAVVTFPFVYPTHNPIEHEGLRYTENAIRRLAERCQLEIVELIPRRPDTDLLVQFYGAEGMRAAKGYNHHVIGWIATFRRAT